MGIVKKIGFIGLLLSLIAFVPINVFAEEGGLLDGKPFYIADDIHSEPTGTNDKLTDGDKGWTNVIGGHKFYYYEFETPVNITFFKIRAQETAYQNIVVKYYDSNKNELKSHTVSEEDDLSMVKPVSFGAKNVSFISIENISSKWVNVYEFDVFNGIPDRDGDGIPDDEDEYPDDPTNTPPDRDGDGIPDDEDEYPDDPTNTPPPPSKPEEVPEVQNLQIETDGEQVDLSWKNPPQFFDKAKIYRKDLGSSKETAFNWNPFAPTKVNASADFEPLFETNGTEFTDLSIEPETEYEYKVTSNYNGMESKGVTVSASVPTPPLVSTKDVKLPFGIGELIKSGNGLLGLIGGFVLLALAFVFVPKVIVLIRGANTGSNGVTAERARRIGKQPKVTDRQMNLATGNGRKGREGRQPKLRDRQMKGV